MLARRTVVVSAALLAIPAAFACSGKSEEIAGGPSLGGSGVTAGANSVAGSTAGGGGSGTQGGASSTAGSNQTNGGSGGSGVAGGGGSAGGATGGATTGGSGGASVGGSGGADPGDTPPWRPLNVQASADEHVHGKAGMDGRAKSLGKLVVDIGVNEGGYSGFLAKRGYHSLGAPCGACPAPDLGNNRDDVGNCRLMEFETTKASVLKQLTDLQKTYPEEDWGYFLSQDGKSVRWSDVAITGISHGATTAAIAGRLGARMWRIVSRSGPRDNVCGLGDGKCTLPLSTPSYDVNCADKDVASWLDKPSLTPMERFYGLVGMTDGQCGDIMFDMHRTNYIGMPRQFDVQGADLTGTNQFFAASAGHYDFLAAPNGVMNTPEVLEIAFGIPPENRNPKF
ncbi:MAG TPA: hypothetical protein VHB79_33160 [Polyangiaceae bacterium]|nr:hypothetical protein [Polyangiaceae bacterium]